MDEKFDCIVDNGNVIDTTNPVGTGNKYNYAFMLIFDNETLNSISNHNRSFGQSVRCLAR